MNIRKKVVRLAVVGVMFCTIGCSLHHQKQEMVPVEEAPDTSLYIAVDNAVSPIKHKWESLNTLKKLNDTLRPTPDSFVPTYKEGGWWMCMMSDQLYSLPPVPRYRDFFISHYYTFIMPDGKKYALEIKGDGRKDNRTKMKIEDVPLTNRKIFVKDLSTGKVTAFVFL